MPDINLNLAGLPSENPVVTIPTGWRYILGSSTAARVDNTLGFFSTDDLYSGWEYSSPLSPVASVISTQHTYQLFVNSDGVSASVIKGVNGGYMLIAESFNVRILRIGANINTAPTVLGSVVQAKADGDVYRLEYNVSTGVINCFRNGTNILSRTDTTYAADALFGGFASKSAGRRAGVEAATVFNVADPVVITSINSGNPITVGQTGVVIAHTGFTGAVTSVTTNRAGVTCAITAGDASSTTVTVSGWVEGGAYPVVNNTVTFTCTRGAESASATQTLTKPANYAQVTFSGAITDDPNLIGYHLAANGHTVNGGTFYYRTNQVSTLTVNADTSWTSDPAGGTFSATFIPSAGATSGNAYLFDITLLNGSIVSVQGLTSAGLTSTGLTSSGLTSAGLC